MEWYDWILWSVVGGVIGAIIGHLCRPSSASPTCSIAVPVAELQKLEEAREQLYEFLDDKLAERDMIGLANITGQMWRVANTKSWDRQ